LIQLNRVQAIRPRISAATADAFLHASTKVQPVIDHVKPVRCTCSKSAAKRPVKVATETSDGPA